jgi:hypothetical protein
VPQAQLLPVRVTRWDDALEAHVVRVVGYRASCPCGWQSPTRPKYADARRELLEHRRAEHGHRGS